MSTIRPDFPQSLPAATPATPSAQMRTAQAAFFRAALSEVQTAPARKQPQTSAPAGGEAPQSPRLPRPGQLLDIRV